MAVGDSIIKIPKKIGQEDTQQRQIEEFIRSVSNVEILQGKLVKSITVGASGADFVLEHKLSRPIKGYILVNSNHPLQLYRGSTSTLEDIFTHLRANYSGASSAPIVDLWVF